MVLKRNEVDDKDKWDVEAIYSNYDEWESSFKLLSEDVLKIIQFKGTLNTSDALLSFLNHYSQVISKIEHLNIYAHMKKDEDTKNDLYRNMYDRISTLYVLFSENTSWVNSEIQLINEDKINSFYVDKKLLNYSFYIKKIRAAAEHTLTDREEELLAMYELPLSAIHNAFSALQDADMLFNDVKDSNEKTMPLTHSLYMCYIHSKDRELRKNAWFTYQKTYLEHINVLSTLLQGEIQTHYTTAKARKYDSSLHASLEPEKIPVSVYENLISTVRRKISVLHKYIAYRKKKLNVDTLHFYDLYVPLVEYPEMSINYSTARDMVLESVKPLGEEYYSILKKGLFEDRWVDVYETPNKRSGAYSTGGYNTRPYILLNFNNTLDAAQTLAHEAGHSMHSYFTQKNQPSHYNGYSIFLAEVASTFNEQLLNHYLLQSNKDPAFRSYIINCMIEDLRGTLFRQTLFAEFELIIHKHTENNIPLTRELLNKEYRELYLFYYGTELTIDEELPIEWSRIPHFYYNFYVYQYATGISAAISLFKKVINGDEKDLADYIGFLKSGSSAYPVEILKKAGVDMTDSTPIIDAISYFSALLDELIEIEG